MYVQNNSVQLLWNGNEEHMKFSLGGKEAARC